MDSVKSHAQDTLTSVGDTVRAAPEHADRCVEDCSHIEREPTSQPPLNFVADVISSQECSQAPTSGATLASSQQPSPEFLVSLGIKVRDFAYENTLPAIVPVPRVPRQVQPAPRALKRSQRDWDSKEGRLNSSSPVRSFPGTKKPRSLERKVTEPLQEPAVRHVRTLERITVKGVCSILAPPSRTTLPTTSRTHFSASPPTSPLTPLSRFASQASGLVEASTTLPFVVHVDNASTAPSQLDSDSQPLSLRPVLYTRLTLDARSSPCRSPTPHALQNASPAPLLSPCMGLPSLSKESGTDPPRVRKRRSREMPPPSNRYQLRQRPIASSRASAPLRRSHLANGAPKSPPRRTRPRAVKS